MKAHLHMSALCVSRTGWGPRPALPRASACVCGLGKTGFAPRPSALVSLVSRRPPGCSREHTPQNVLQVRSGWVRHSGELGVQAVPTSPVSVSVHSPTLTPPSPWRQAGHHAQPRPWRLALVFRRDERVHRGRADVRPDRTLMCGGPWVDDADSPVWVSRLWVAAGVCRQVEQAHPRGFQVPSGAFQSHMAF